jgi:protein TonB
MRQSGWVRTGIVFAVAAVGHLRDNRNWHRAFMTDMGTTKDQGLSGPVGHIAVHIDDQHPAEVSFLFEQPRRRLPGAAVASFLTHAAFFLVVVLIVRYAPQTLVTNDADQFHLVPDIIWLNQPGPGGGGGGGGNRMPQLPRKAELPGKDKTTVPVVKPVEEPVPEEKPKDEPKPEQQLNIPAVTTAAGDVPVAGVLESTSAANSTSLGPGSGGGAGTGTGTGIGPGQGSGLGPGWGGGTGGGAYRPGNGVDPPILVKEVKPNYTPEAMRAKIQGSVWLECVVVPEGVCADIQVVRSLDPVFGLDQEAIKAARQWRFVAGKRLGQPVPVLVTIELNFALR